MSGQNTVSKHHVSWGPHSARVLNFSYQNGGKHQIPGFLDDGNSTGQVVQTLNYAGLIWHTPASN